MSLSLGTLAIVLLRLDARRDELPVSVADLASHVGAKPREVVDVILDLERRGYALAQRSPSGDVLGAVASACGVATARGAAARPMRRAGACA